MNEELQSTSEDLLSTSEERETSKEELPLLNEALMTPHGQLAAKVHQLEDINTELSNLLASTGIATLLLDRHFHLRRYTPAATRLLSLVPSDIGRAMTDVASRLDDPGLLADARKVLAGLEVAQQEVRTRDGAWYLRRLLPYRTEDEPLHGVVVTFTEITQRKEAELALAESERTLRRITDAMPALMSYVDTEQRYRFSNAAYQRWFQLDAEAVRTRSVAEIVGADAYAVIAPRLRRALAGEPQEYDAWLDYRHAGRRYVHAQYIPDRRDDGTVAGVYILVSDITERRRGEEEIERLHNERRARLAEMQAVLDAAPIGIFVGRDVACRDMVMNRAGARMLRLPEDANPSLTGPDAAAMPFRVFHKGRELAADELPMQVAARRGERIDGFEEELVFDDGEVRTLITYAAPLRGADGQVRGCVGTFADLTAERAAERRYRETLERLELHLDNTPVAALEWDAELRVLRWSPAAERVFGWTPGEALGQTIGALGLVQGQDRAALLEAMAALLNGEAERNRIVARSRRRDGGSIWCEWYNSVLRDNDGALISVMSLAMDITDRQQLEADLRVQAERLAETDRRKDEFLSMLGHELRNPLAPVRNAIAVMECAGGDRDRVDWACGIIDRQTRHLERLVDDLLDTARITRGAVQLKTAPLDLRAIVQEAVESTEHAVRERGHRIEVLLPEAPIVVTGDTTRLVQVMTNLITNAAKYTGHGGWIRVALTQESGMARIEVADNGRGITAEDLPYVFDVFSQGRRSLARADGGLGLGLPLVKRLTEMHGGAVAIASPGSGQGSRVTIRLPMSGTLPAAPDAAGDGGEHCERSADPHAQVGQAAGRRILLADDNPDVLESLQFFLQAHGHEVSVVPGGARVVELVKQTRPDFVILDIGLPDIDGIEVARRLARLPQRRAFRVIALSGYIEQVVDAKLFDGHVLKGSNPMELARLLE